MKKKVLFPGENSEGVIAIVLKGEEAEYLYMYYITGECDDYDCQDRLRRFIEEGNIVILKKCFPLEENISC